MVKTCVYKSCPSSSRNDKDMGFVRFVSPEFDYERAKLWIEKVSRPDFTLEKIDRVKFICERHFPSETLDYDFRSNLDLTPYEEGTPLGKVMVLSNYQNYKYEKTIKTYEKRPQKIVKYYPVYHGIRDNSETAKIDLEGKLSFKKLE